MHYSYASVSRLAVPPTLMEGAPPAVDERYSALLPMMESGTATPVPITPWPTIDAMPLVPPAPHKTYISAITQQTRPTT